jgi:ketosteroid isomerase-like protein
MGTAVEIVKQAYEAFGRADVPAILALVHEEVDWEFVGSPDLLYAGPRKNHKEVADFFGAIAQVDDIHAFEPREFIECGEHLTVLGWEKTTSRDTGVSFESEWVHVFTIKDGKVACFRAFYNTAARYGK